MKKFGNSSSDWHSSILSDSQPKSTSESIHSNIFAALEAYEKELQTNLDALACRSKGSKLSESRSRRSISQSHTSLPTISEMGEVDDDEMPYSSNADFDNEISEIRNDWPDSIDSVNDFSELMHLVHGSPVTLKQKPISDDDSEEDEPIMEVSSEGAPEESEDESFDARFAHSNTDSGEQTGYEYSSFLKDQRVDILPTIGEDEEAPIPSSNTMSGRFSDSSNDSDMNDLQLIISQLQQSQNTQESAVTNPSSIISTAISDEFPRGVIIDDHSSREYSGIPDGMVLKDGSSIRSYYEEEEQSEPQFKPYLTDLSNSKYSGVNVQEEIDESLNNDINELMIEKESEYEYSDEKPDFSVNTDFIEEKSSTLIEDDFEPSQIEISENEFIEPPDLPDFANEEGTQGSGFIELPSEDFVESRSVSENVIKLPSDDEMKMSEPESSQSESDGLSAFIEMPVDSMQSRAEGEIELPSVNTDISGSGFIELPSVQSAVVNSFTDDSVSNVGETDSGFIDLPSMKSEAVNSSGQESDLSGSGFIDLPSVQSGVVNDLSDTISESSGSTMQLASSKVQDISGSGFIDVPSTQSNIVNSLSDEIELSSEASSAASADISGSGFIDIPSTQSNIVNSLSDEVEISSDSLSNSNSEKRREKKGEISSSGFIDIPSTQSNIVNALSDEIELSSESTGSTRKRLKKGEISGSGFIDIPSSESGVADSLSEEVHFSSGSSSSSKKRRKRKESISGSGFIDIPSTQSNVVNSLSDEIELSSGSASSSKKQRKRKESISGSGFIEIPSTQSKTVNSDSIELSSSQERLSKSEFISESSYSHSSRPRSRHTTSSTQTGELSATIHSNSSGNVLSEEVEFSSERSEETITEDFVETYSHHVSEKSSLGEDFTYESNIRDPSGLDSMEKQLIVSRLSMLDAIETDPMGLSISGSSSESGEFHGRSIEEGQHSKHIHGDDMDEVIPMIPKSLARHVKTDGEKVHRRRSRHKVESHARLGVTKTRSIHIVEQPKPASPRRTRLEISTTFDAPSKFEFETKEEDEVFIDDISASMIDAREQVDANATNMDLTPVRKLTFSPFMVQKDIKPRKKKSHRHHTEITPVPHTAQVRFADYAQTPQPQRQRATNISFSRSILSESRVMPTAAEMVDRNFMNTLQTARQQLTHIKESIHASRRMRAMRSSMLGSFEYTQNPFSSVEYPP